MMEPLSCSSSYTHVMLILIDCDTERMFVFEYESLVTGWTYKSARVQNDLKRIPKYILKYVGIKVICTHGVTNTGLS